MVDWYDSGSDEDSDEDFSEDENVDLFLKPSTGSKRLRNTVERFVVVHESRKKGLKKKNPNESTQEPPNKKAKTGANLNLTPIVGEGSFYQPRPDNQNKLHLYFMAMGQGDCTIIVSPDNKIFIIDMGTDGEEEYINGETSYHRLVNLLRQDAIFGQDSRAEAIIITHSDADHNNLLGFLIDLGVTSRRIYHTNTLSSYTKSSRSGVSPDQAMRDLREVVEAYRLSGVSYTTGLDEPIPQPSFAQMQNQTFAPEQEGQPAPSPLAPVQQYRSIYSNIKTSDDPLTVETGFPRDIPNNRPAPQDPVPPFPIREPLFEPYYVAGEGVTIYDDDNGFSIRILVANYRNCQNVYDISKPSDDLLYGDWPTEYDDMRTDNRGWSRTDAKDINRASSVIHIRYAIPGTDNVEDYIICGDATQEPLDMIRREYPTLRDVTILQVPHHGAKSNGSNDPNFAGQMNPQIAVFSSPYYNEKHHHPRGLSVQNFENTGRRTYDVDMESNYGYWNKLVNGEFRYQNRLAQPYRIYVTGWMEAGYYHYTAPITTPTNIPNFRPSYPIPPPPPPGGSSPMEDDSDSSDED